jgi:hypothetical protein
VANPPTLFLAIEKLLEFTMKEQTANVQVEINQVGQGIKTKFSDPFFENVRFFSSAIL